MAATWAGHKIDGYDHAMPADIPKGYFAGSAGGQVATADTAFNRGYGLSGGDRTMQAKGGGNHQTWRFASRMRRGGATAENFLQIRDAGLNQMYVRLTAAGDLEAYTATGSLLGTASGVFPANTWLWVEILVYIHGSSGVVIIFVSDTTTPVLNLTGVDTQNTANAYAQTVFTTGDSTLKLDDTHYSWGSGVPVTGDALGDSTVISDHAVTQGDFSDFTPDSGTNHVNRVRDATAGTLADGDSTYLSDNAAGDEESMLFDDLPVDITDINFVQITAEIRKNDAASRTIKIGTRTGGTTTYDSAQNVTDTYQFLDFLQEEDPDTSSPWTRSGVNGTQGVVKLES